MATPKPRPNWESLTKQRARKRLAQEILPSLQQVTTEGELIVALALCQDDPAKACKLIITLQTYNLLPTQFVELIELIA